MTGDQIDSLEAWAAEASAEAMAAVRSRTHWLRHQADEQAQFRGVLTDLAERRLPISVTTASGRVHYGRLCALGQDFAALTTAAGTEVLVALDALVTVRTTDASPSSGDRADDGNGLLTDELAELAPLRPRLQLVARNGQAVAGELRSVGLDVAVLAVDSDPPGLVYVSTAWLSEAVVLASG